MTRHVLRVLRGFKGDFANLIKKPLNSAINNVFISCQYELCFLNVMNFHALKVPVEQAMENYNEFFVDF